jgi:type VI secretion system secreted protein Hcp
MLAAGAAAPGTALAEDELFLNLGDIRGESTDEHHKKEIVLLSYSQSFTHPDGAGGIANCGAIRVSKMIDKSSPALIKAVLTARNIPQAVITFRKPGTAPFEYYKVTLTNVIIQAITQSDRSPDRIVEDVTLISGGFRFEYFLPTATGASTPVTLFWDCVRNTGG